MLQQLVSDIESLSTGTNETIVSSVAERQVASTQIVTRSTATSYRNDADNWVDDGDSEEHGR
jgi:hypothetical protein